MANGEKPWIEAIGGIHVGKSFLKSFQATWPFGKIEVYEDHILLKIQYVPGFFLRLFERMDSFPAMMGTYNNIPYRIELKYSDIKAFKETNAFIWGYGLTFIHKDEESAPFLQVWIAKNKAKKIIERLNQNNIFYQKNKD